MATNEPSQLPADIAVGTDPADPVVEGPVRAGPVECVDSTLRVIGEFIGERDGLVDE